MKRGIKTKVSFWATKGGYKWNNNKMRILNNKILKVEDELIMNIVIQKTLQDYKKWKLLSIKEEYEKSHSRED